MSTHRNRSVPAEKALFASALLVLLLLAAPAASAQTPGVSGDNLTQDCKNYPESERPRNCELFASAFVEFARSHDKTQNPRGRLCIDEDVPASEIIALINAWLAEHPDAGNMNGYEIAYSATQDRYRCR